MLGAGEGPTKKLPKGPASEHRAQAGDDKHEPRFGPFGQEVSGCNFRFEKYVILHQCNEPKTAQFRMIKYVLLILGVAVSISKCRRGCLFTKQNEAMIPATIIPARSNLKKLRRPLTR